MTPFEEMRLDRDSLYEELKNYEITLPDNILSLGLELVIQYQITLSKMLNRVEGMKEEALRAHTISECICDSLENSYWDMLALLIQTGVTDEKGNCIYTAGDMQAMKSKYMQESAALRNPDLRKISDRRRSSSVERTLAKGYLSTVDSRYKRLESVSYEINNIKEVLLKIQPVSTMSQPTTVGSSFKPVIKQARGYNETDLDVEVVS